MTSTPVESVVDCSAVASKQVSAATTGGTFIGMSARDATAITIDVYSGTTTGGDLLWTGTVSASASPTDGGNLSPPAPIPFDNGLFVDFSAAADKCSVLVG